MTDLCDLAGLSEKTFEPGAALLTQARDGPALCADRGRCFDHARRNRGRGPWTRPARCSASFHAAARQAAHGQRRRGPSTRGGIENGEAFLRSSPRSFRWRVLAARLRMLTSYLGDLKQQFADKGDDHFGMVDIIIAGMTQHQGPSAVKLGSERDPASRRSHTSLSGGP